MIQEHQLGLATEWKVHTGIPCNVKMSDNIRDCQGVEVIIRHQDGSVQTAA